MSEYSRAQWAVAEALADPVQSFILWAVDSGLCARLSDFHHHFGPEYPAGRDLEELFGGGLLREREDRLMLTELGAAAVARLHAASTAESSDPDAARVTAAEPSSGAQPTHGGIEARAPREVRYRRYAAGERITWHDQVVLQVLRERYPDEIDLLGDQVVAAIVEGRRALSPTTGARADLTELVEVLAAVAGVVRAALALIEQIRGDENRTPSPERVHVELARRGELPTRRLGTPLDDLLHDLTARMEP